MQASRGDLGLRAAAALLAWLAGTALQLQQAALWPPWVHAALVALALPLVLWASMRPNRTGLLCLALCGLAFGATALRAGQRLDAQLAPALEGRDLLLVRHRRQPAAGVARAACDSCFAVERAFDGEAAAPVPGRISLGWLYGLADDGSVAAPRPDLRAGQRWRLTVRLRRPHGNLNPHGFDYELSLFEQGVRATGYVRDTRPARGRLLDDTLATAGRAARQARARRDRCCAWPMRGWRGVLAALAVGDQAAIERDDWDLFRNTGVAHLMSISGLHVTMFAWLAGALIARALAAQRARLLWLPAPQAGRWGGLIAGHGLRAAGRLGRAGAAHALDAGSRGAAAQRRAALAVAAGAARRRGAGRGSRPLGAAAGRLLAVVRCRRLC